MVSEALRGMRLLVVEDNEIAREGLALVLRRAGFVVVMAADGEEALAHLRSGPPPDLILLDMMLPGTDGWAFLERRRREPAVASVPILITTGLGVASAEWAEALGAVGCLRKPIETETLFREVTRCCARRAKK
jgi:CheY-like chemotaxis protein